MLRLDLMQNATYRMQCAAVSRDYGATTMYIRQRDLIWSLSYIYRVTNNNATVDTWLLSQELIDGLEYQTNARQDSRCGLEQQERHKLN